jgi:hypothetical protein
MARRNAFAMPFASPFSLLPSLGEKPDKSGDEWDTFLQVCHFSGPRIKSAGCGPPDKQEKQRDQR